MSEKRESAVEKLLKEWRKLDERGVTPGQVDTYGDYADEVEKALAEDKANELLFDRDWVRSAMREVARGYEGPLGADAWADGVFARLLASPTGTPTGTELKNRLPQGRKKNG